MMKRMIVLATGCVLGALVFVTPSMALSMKECSAKYKAAKADGSAKDINWNDYRKSQCATAAAAEPDASLATSEEAPKPTVATAPEGVTFPSAISTKYAAEKPAKARMHTCVDSYKENKAANTLNGLKWIQKGGGYYSLCNAKLKT